MDNNLALTSITSGAACAYIIQMLQNAKSLPWITAHTDGINRTIRLAASGIATLGISFAWSAAPGDMHTLTFMIPSGGVILHGAFHWFGQYALQHGWGKVLSIQPPAVAAKDTQA